MLGRGAQPAGPGGLASHTCPPEHPNGQVAHSPTAEPHTAQGAGSQGEQNDLAKPLFCTGGRR